VSFLAFGKRKNHIMPTRYETLIRDNLARFFDQALDDAASRLGAQAEGGVFSFRAFGEECRLSAGGITLSGHSVWAPVALLVSLYAVHARPEPVKLEPFQSFKDLPDSMPYHGAFAANAERILIPHVPKISEKRASITALFQGRESSPESGGDFGFILFPLPKLALCYIFYLPDDEFPASATCLFSANALSFMPLDGLADVGEYTSKAVMDRVTS
jgi:hypothetical protein